MNILGGGPPGERLFLDFATIGPDDADNAILVTSGTHGPEAFCGSGIQIQLLSSPDILGDLRGSQTRVSACPQSLGLGLDAAR